MRLSCLFESVRVARVCGVNYSGGHEELGRFYDVEGFVDTVIGQRVREVEGFTDDDGWGGSNYINASFMVGNCPNLAFPSSSWWDSSGDVVWLVSLDFKGGVLIKITKYNDGARWSSTGSSENAVAERIKGLWVPFVGLLVGRGELLDVCRRSLSFIG